MFPLIGAVFGQTIVPIAEATGGIISACDEKPLHDREAQAKGDAPGFAGVRAGP